MAETRRPEAAPGASRGASQRDRFRDSLRDAVDGIDVAELQGTRAAVAQRMPVPPAAETERAAPDPEQLRAAVERELAPLHEEVAALRTEVTRLYRARVDRGGEALIYGGLLLLMLLAGAALALVLRH